VQRGSPQRSVPSLARFAALAFAALYLPPLLILSGAIPFAYRYVALAVVAAALGIVALAQGTSARALGLRSDNLKSALALNALLTLAVGGCLLLAYWKGLIRTPRQVDWRWFAPFYVLVSCPAQEFACRGFLFAEMEKRGITGAGAQIAISAVSYAFLHAIYRDWLAFLAPLAIGVVWGAIYRRWPNLWGVVFSHAVLGLISIFVGLI
jgi:membrane protease YdiL (CAAX protease family)